MSEITVPRLNNNDVSYVLLEWLFDDGQDVPGGAAVAVVETAKAAEEIVADSGGVLRQSRRPGDECGPGDVLGSLLPEPEDAGQEPAPPSDEAGPGARDGASAQFTLTGPAAALVAEHGIPRSALASLAKPVLTRADVQPLAQGNGTGGAVVEIGRHQQAVAATVERSLHEVPQAFALMKVGGSALARRRRAVREETGLLISSLELLVLAAGRLASEHPMVYARRIDGTRAELPDDVHIGVTVDSGHGLYIPVLRSVPGKSLAEVTGQLEEFRRRSLTGDFRARELTGAHLSVSMAGYTDLVCSVPFVQPGQTCMLSLCGTQYETDPATGSRIPFFNVGLSYDHRLVNGRLAARYLKSVKALLESPDGLAGLCGDLSRSVHPDVDEGEP